MSFLLCLYAQGALYEHCTSPHLLLMKQKKRGWVFLGGETRPPKKPKKMSRKKGTGSFGRRSLASETRAKNVGLCTITEGLPVFGLWSCRFCLYFYLSLRSPTVSRREGRRITLLAGVQNPEGISTCGISSDRVILHYLCLTLGTCPLQIKHHMRAQPISPDRAFLASLEGCLLVGAGFSALKHCDSVLRRARWFLL